MTNETNPITESHHAIKDQILRDIHIGRDGKLRSFLWDTKHTHIYGSVVKENNGIFISWILFDDGQKELAQYGDLEAIVIAIAKRWW